MFVLARDLYEFNRLFTATDDIYMCPKSKQEFSEHQGHFFLYTKGLFWIFFIHDSLQLCVYAQSMK